MGCTSLRSGTIEYIPSGPNDEARNGYFRWSLLRSLPGNGRRQLSDGWGVDDRLRKAGRQMTHLALFFVGSVYLINGLGLLGLIEPKGSAPLNVLIGSLLLAVTGYLVLPVSDLAAQGSLDTVVSSVGYLLFALTFLYVGIINYTGHPNSGLGWYCGWSAIVSACLSAVQFLHYGDVKSAALWAVWTVVFIAFFALIILKADRIGRATGWFVIVAGFTTCFVPGGLLILGRWNGLSNNVVLVMEVGTVALFGLLLLGSAGKVQSIAEQRPA